jgi:acyl carrier protein
MDDRRSEITAKIFALAAEHGDVDADRISVETNFVTDLHFDSLQMVEFTMDLEEELELTIPDEEAATLLTVGAVVEYVLAHLSDAARISA